MKKFFLFLILIYSVSSFAQTPSCCAATNTSFAGLSNDKEFISAHASPLPFKYASEKGKMITYKTTEGKDVSAFFIQSKQKSSNYLFVFHEWWGLNDYIKQISEKLFNDVGNINVIALDLFNGKVATNADEAALLTGSVEPNTVLATINGALLYAKSLSGNNIKVGTIGWCFGGGWSLQASIEAGKNAAACVMYYGMPEENTDRLNTLQTDVLFIQATQDKWINAQLVNSFKEDMIKINKNITVISYDADHAFANPSNPNYNKEAGDDAYIKTLAYLKEAFKK